MKVRTLEPLNTPQGEIPAGRIISIPDNLLERLRGKVEPLPSPAPSTTATERGAHRAPCYCCKGTDYWLAGTGKYPHWICRKCHPPAPGAERQAV